MASSLLFGAVVRAEEPVTDRLTSGIQADEGGPAPASVHGSLGRRGRDLLAALRPGDPTPRRSPEAQAAIPVAFVVAADESIDAESAAVALARQLVPPGDAVSRDPDADVGVGLLMLDPLGATLRLFRPCRASAVGGPAPVRGPQFRVANRSEWPVLLARLNGQTAILLVLDTTGRQHQLQRGAGDGGRDDSTFSREPLASAFEAFGDEPRASTPESSDSRGAAPTVIVVTTADTAGRLAGYRKLKELDRDGAGSLGAFFVARESADVETSPLADRAQATFTRLAAAAGQFLSRRLVFFGVAHGGAGQSVAAEMLGQRPSADGHENRADLTRWLNDHSAPLACEPAGEGDADAEPIGRPAPLRVVPVERWPRDELELADLLGDHVGLLSPSASLLAFRPPCDRSVLLAAGGAPGGSAALTLIRPLGDGESRRAGAVGSLLAAARWAEDHWPLLRQAYPRAGLAEQPRLVLALAGEGLDGDADLRRLAAAQRPPVTLFNLVQVDLGQSADDADGPRTGLLIQPVSPAD